MVARRPKLPCGRALRAEAGRGRALVRIALILALAFPPLGAAAKSLALIVGNDSYGNIAQLQKARADARSYSELFTGLGYAVTRIEDADAATMAGALTAFYASIAEGDTVAFLYSGHGWSDGNTNYLVATDAPAGGTEDALAAMSFALRNGRDGILDRIAERKPGLTLAVVDACRNNPFQVTGTRGLALGRGLVAERPASGTFIAFSAGVGQTALDGLSRRDRDPNSVFTRHFLSELRKPQDLRTAFKTAQTAVYLEAETVGHAQRPAYYDEIVGEVCLTGRCGIPASSPRQPWAGQDTAGTPETSDSRVAVSQDWATFAETEAGICWAATTPIVTRDLDRAGIRLAAKPRAVVLSANFFRGRNDIAEVTFTGGYDLDEETGPLLEIGSLQFTFGARGVWAWTSGPSADARIVAAMQSENRAVLTVRSADGHMFSYTFSLRGFAESLETARQYCR